MVIDQYIILHGDNQQTQVQYPISLSVISRLRKCQYNLWPWHGIIKWMRRMVICQNWVLHTDMKISVSIMLLFFLSIKIIDLSCLHFNVLYIFVIYIIFQTIWWFRLVLYVIFGYQEWLNTVIKYCYKKMCCQLLLTITFGKAYRVFNMFFFPRNRSWTLDRSSEIWPNCWFMIGSGWQCNYLYVLIHQTHLCGYYLIMFR